MPANARDAETLKVLETLRTTSHTIGVVYSKHAIELHDQGRPGEATVAQFFSCLAYISQTILEDVIKLGEQNHGS